MEEYSKVLARYYFKWFSDSCDSIQYCMKKRDFNRANKYEAHSRMYLTLIMENYDEIVAETEKAELEKLRIK